jgi:hypothetical protein
MNKTVNTIVWVALFLFLLPSSLAVASWNSLPGTTLFTTKLFMEQALAFVVPTAQAKGDLQIMYTERRFTEAKHMIVGNSSAKGLSYLDDQVQVTRQAIVNAPSPVVKKQLAQKYIVALQDVSTQLEQQRQIAYTQAPQVVERTVVHTTNVYVTNVVYVNPTATPAPTPTPSPTSTPQTQTTPAEAEHIIASITTSQEHISETITQMQQIADDAGSIDVKDNKGKGKGSNK